MGHTRKHIDELDFESVKGMLGSALNLSAEDIKEMADKATPRQIWATAHARGLPKRLVKRPASWAMGSYTLDRGNPPVSLFDFREAAKRLLVDGYVLYDLPDLDWVNPEHVKTVRFRGSIPSFVRYEWRDAPNKVMRRREWARMTRDKFENLVRGQEDASDEKIADLLDEQKTFETNPEAEMEEGTSEIIEIYREFDAAKTTEELNKQEPEIQSKKFPFVGVSRGESIYSGVKYALLLYSTSAEILHDENRRHGQRSMVQKGGPDQLAEKKVGGKDESVLYLPSGPDVDLYYPDTQPEALDPVLRELRDIKESIIETTGVVSIRQLAGESGAARQVAQSQLARISENIQDRMRGLLGQINGEFSTGVEMTIKDVDIMSTEDKVRLFELYKRQHDAGHLSDEEFERKSRKLVGLGETVV